MSITLARATGWFRSLPDRRVLVVGDLMLDEYLWGQPERISPEAPVPVVPVNHRELRLGGAGNVALNLAVLGCRVTAGGVLGEDEEGREVFRLLQEGGVDSAGLLTTPHRLSTRKTRVIAQHQQMLRIDREEKAPLAADLEARLLERLDELLAEADLLLLSDYRKGVLTERVVTSLIELCRERGLPVLIDPKGDDYRHYAGATLLTPNRNELAAAIGYPLTDQASLVAAAERLRETLDLDALVVTRSEEGMSLFEKNRPAQHLPTRAQDVFDISGAGDTVIATLAAALSGGLSLPEAVQLANLAAGIVVGKVGTSTVTPREILTHLDQEGLAFSRKILDRQTLPAVLAGERRQGRQIVFTNGCFDLLHVGHVKYLQKARAYGDLLVLGLNADSSIRRLKGPQRPLIGEEERAHILAALDAVDYVVLFGEDTPLELIQEIRPDILVKGGDYAPDQVVGREFVESYGGRLELVQFVDGKSTTNIINRILEAYQE